MYRIGLVGEQWVHYSLYPAFFNGIPEEEYVKPQWPRVYLGDQAPKPDDDMRVTDMWSGSHDDRGICQMWDLHRHASLEGLAQKVDAALILDKNGARHLALAEPFLKRGLPVFIDKPFAETVEDADEILRLADKHGTAVFGGSALSQTIEAATVNQKIAADIVRVVTTYGSGEYWEYASHPIQLGLSLMPKRLTQVSKRLCGTTWCWFAGFEGGSLLVVQLLPKGSYPGFHATISGEFGLINTQVDNMPHAFRSTYEMMRRTFAANEAQIDYRLLTDAVKIITAPDME